MCTVLLSPGVSPVTVNKYIILYIIPIPKHASYQISRIRQAAKIVYFLELQHEMQYQMTRELLLSALNIF